MAERAEDLQSEALRAFTLLSSLRQSWAGALIVACGLGPRGAALTMAGNIAGAGCLAIEERADVGRAALRSGACDFIVNTVDEALRVLKNEIRQRKPVSVGLTMDMAAALNELIDRGVLPELFTAFEADGDTVAADRAAREFGLLGTLIVDLDGSLTGADGSIDGEKRLEDSTREHGQRLESFSFASAEELRAFDARLAEVLPAADARRRWLAGAPRFFHRERPYRRVVYLTAAERDTVTGA